MFHLQTGHPDRGGVPGAARGADSAPVLPLLQRSALPLRYRPRLAAMLRLIASIASGIMPRAHAGTSSRKGAVKKLGFKAPPAPGLNPRCGTAAAPAPADSTIRLPCRIAVKSFGKGNKSTGVPRHRPAPLPENQNARRHCGEGVSSRCETSLLEPCPATRRQR